MRPKLSSLPPSTFRPSVLLHPLLPLFSINIPLICLPSFFSLPFILPLSLSPLSHLTSGKLVDTEDPAGQMGQLAAEVRMGYLW
jgi:hypothetical protein